MACRPAVWIDQRRQFGAAIETYRPAALAPHVLRRHFGFLLHHAGLEMRAVPARECRAPCRGQPAFWVFFGRLCLALAWRFLRGATLARGLRSVFLRGLLLRGLFLL